jgi:Helix-turn-helix domain
MSKKKHNSFIKLTMPQKTFLEGHLRGTERQISEAQAAATYGIKNLRARVAELRQAGLKVHTSKNTEGRATYSMSSRDVFGSRAKLFV